MGSTIIEQDFPYDILHRGKRDERRHNKRVDQAARKQLGDIISQQDIITSEGNKKIKVRLKYLDQFRFIHHHDRVDEIGRDEFNELDEGEILQKPQPGGGGQPMQAGQEAGEELYEAEYTIDELTDLMIEELELPDLDETKKNEIISEVIEWEDRRKSSGIHALIDKRKTLMANIKRRAAMGKKEPIPIINDDLRFRTWNVQQEKHSNAVIFLMMDRSASMWEQKIYTVKALYFWVVQFLRRKYDKVEIRFIAHDYYAKELSEKEFFTIADSGGTRVSSAYAMCQDMIKHNYPSNMWNIYCFHASDGDSWGDEVECLKIVNDIISMGATLFAYTEINMDNYRGGESDLLSLFKQEMMNNDSILVSVIEDISDILATLQVFLKHSTRHAYDRA